MFRSLRVAVGFLTRLPVNPKEFKTTDLGDSVRFFPLVGIVYGGLTWGLLHLCTRFTTIGIAAWITVFAGAFLNGCIHWDGFADTADGLGSPERERGLAIMKDSRLGAFGGIALVFLIVGKIVSLQGLGTYSLAGFVSIAALSRWGLAFQIYTQPSVSKGLLQAFQPQNVKRDFWLATIFMLVIISFAGMSSLLLLAVVLATLLIANLFIRKRFGGITGDILGAANELLELVCWLVLNIRLNW
jgi:adenosylcobinamide-GDP ribazoletransferase